MAPDAYPTLRRVARRLGYHLVRADYYSPIPDVANLPPETWTEPEPMPGVELNLEKAFALLENDLAGFVEEFAPPPDPPGTRFGYHYANPMYGAVDGELLYALLRHLKPGRMLEIGAGYSTLASAEALARNAAEGHPCEHAVIDPYPSPVLGPVRDRIALEALPADRLGPERFASLGDGDVLFIDTTHTIKPRNDVTHLLLKMLPEVAPGVVVHVHDFFRPFEYPRMLFEQFHVYWQEQHLLQAFLAFNHEFEVLLPNHAMSRLQADRLTASVPSFTPDAMPSGLWLRRTARRAG